MDNLQVRGLQNQTARPNASNPGLGTSLQSQNRGLNTQQVRSICWDIVIIGQQHMQPTLRKEGCHCQW
jgi:hypothetical protein